MTDKEYRYYKENGKLMRLHLEQDDDPLNPRVDFDCNIGRIICFGNNCGYLGDKQNKWNDEEDFFKEFCMEHLTENQIETLVNKRMEIVSVESPAVEKPNKTEYEKDIRNTVLKYNAMADKARELELTEDVIRYVNMAKAYKKNREDEFEKILRLSKEYKVTNDIGWFQYKGTKEQCEDYINGELRDGLLDGDIFYASAGMYKEAMQMLLKSDVVILPIFVFEHSGISISVSDFGDKWDHGQAGWIYTTKEKVKEMLINWGAKYKDKNGNMIDVTEENWREAATENLKGEIETYNMYLTGEVYGIIIEEYNAEDDDWERTDSCWGFFNGKWGDELIQEVASDFGVSETLYDDMESVA